MLDFSVYRPPESWRMNLAASWKNGPGWRVGPMAVRDHKFR
jgi:hypothetical protein